MIRRSTWTFIDYLFLAINPTLVGLMVATLSWSFVLGFYVGDSRERLLFICLMFSLGSVACSRLALTESFHYAELYIFPFAVVMAIGVAALVQFDGVLTYPGLPLTWVLLALMGWAAFKITADATVLDDEIDATGSGLLEQERDALLNDENSTNPAAASGSPATGSDVPVASPSSQAAQVWGTGLTETQRRMAYGGGGVRTNRSVGDRDPADGVAPDEGFLPAPARELLNRFAPRRKRAVKRHRPPGFYLMRFGLVSVIVMGLIQGLIPAAQADDRQLAMSLLFVHVGSGLALLLSTSLLNLRRYLRQRGMPMAEEMTIRWIVSGVATLALFLLLGMLLPLPGLVWELPIRLATTRRTDTSSAAIGKDGTQVRAQGNGTKTTNDPAATQTKSVSNGSTGSKSSSSGSASAGSSSGSAKSASNSSESKPSGGSGSAQGPSSGSTSSPSQPSPARSGGQSPGERASENPSSGGQSSGSSPGGQPPSGSSSPDAKSDPNATKSTTSPQSSGNSRSSSSSPSPTNSDTANAAAQSQPSNGTSESSSGKSSSPGNRPPENGATDQGSTQEPDSSPASGKQAPPSNQQQPLSSGTSMADREIADGDATKRWGDVLSGLGEMGQKAVGFFGLLLRIGFGLVIVGLMLGLAWTQQAALAEAWRRFLIEIRAWLDWWAGKRSTSDEVASAASELATPPRPFASFADPFQSGMATREAPLVTIRHTFAALEAWARESESPRRPDQTPYEFAVMLGRRHPGLTDVATTLAQLTDVALYSPAGVTAGDVARLRPLWERLRV